MKSADKRIPWFALLTLEEGNTGHTPGTRHKTREETKMYRRYEDPHKVETLLEQAEKRLDEAKAKYADVPDEDYPIDYIADLYNEVESLRERVNFAWQDEEYDENYAHDMGYDQVWDE